MLDIEKPPCHSERMKALEGLGEVSLTLAGTVLLKHPNAIYDLNRIQYDDTRKQWFLVNEGPLRVSKEIDRVYVPTPIHNQSKIVDTLLDELYLHMKQMEGEVQVRSVYSRMLNLVATILDEIETEQSLNIKQRLSLEARSRELSMNTLKLKEVKRNLNYILQDRI